MNRSKVFLYSINALLVFVCSVYPVRARSQDLFDLRGALHSTWAGRDGAPQGIRSLAQAPNGVLWLSAIAGIYTFDGRIFRKYDVPDADIRNKSFGRIFFARSGDLWMQPLHGALLRVRDGEVRKMDRVNDGETSPKIENVQQAGDGTIWAMLNRHWLVSLGSDDVWRRTALPISDPKEDLTALHVDQRGGIWIVLGDRLFFRAASSTQFVPTQTFVYGASSMAEIPDGGLWIGSSGPPTSAVSAHHLQRVNQSGAVVQSKNLRDGISAVIAGYDGSVLALTDQSELLHFRAHNLLKGRMQETRRPPEIQALGTAVQGDGYNELLRDKDGAIWIGGFGGLERFAMATLQPLVPDAPPGLWSHCLVRGGALWVADPQARLFLFKNRRLTTVSPQKSDALFCSAFAVLFRNDEGLWIAGKRGNILLPKPPGLQGYSNHYMFTGAAGLPDGAVLATVSGATIGRSLWLYEQGRWKSLSLPLGYPEITAMHVISRREVLLGLLDGQLAIWEGGTVGKPSAITPEVGSIIGFAEAQSAGILALGTSGVALRSGHAASALHFARPELVQRTTGAAEAADGSLWLNAEEGIVRVPPAQWSAAKDDRTHIIEANNIREENLVGPSEPTIFSDQAQADDLGNIWFSTLDGIVSINPRKNLRDTPPLLVVEDVLGDGRGPARSRRFAPGVSVVSIRYSGIDYRNPLAITYAYKLTGNDADWQNVGSRTEAVYTRLRAGRYAFQVKARDAFGTWSDPVSLEPFAVEPHLYERSWFRISCLLLAATLVWAGVKFRLHFLARIMRDKAEARADERISIARDLHDTLLQGIQGLLLTLHAAAEKVPVDHESRKALERALVSTERFVVEGRDRVKGLRSFSMQAGLERMLIAVAEDGGCRSIVSISTRRPNTTLELNEHVEAEVFLIAREALLNACKHAHAGSISIQLSYLESEFKVSCTDDGHGFERGRREPVIGDVRLGLQGMDERALALGAQLTIISAPKQGTQIMLALPSAKAYRRSRGHTRSRKSR